MAHLSLVLLGPFHATLDGQPVTAFESVKVRALLAYLAVEAERPHARDVLAGLLWPDWPQRSALSNLRYALANLRQALGDRAAQPPFLLISREALQFNPASDHWLDATAFAQVVEDPGATADQLAQAAGWHRGSFLEGFSIADSPALEDWVRVRRERLGRLLGQAFGRLAEAQAQRRDYSAALRWARQLVDLDPLNEAAHQALMRRGPGAI
jgi:DNA-binding SARP family transcriptional activator